MSIKLISQPNAAVGQSKSSAETTPLYGDKKAVAAMLGMSERTVSNFLTQGCPCLRIGKRRTRFDMEEVRAWLKEKFGSQRNGKLAAGKN